VPHRPVDPRSHPTTHTTNPGNRPTRAHTPNPKRTKASGQRHHIGARAHTRSRSTALRAEVHRCVAPSLCRTVSLAHRLSVAPSLCRTISPCATCALPAATRAIASLADAWIGRRRQPKTGAIHQRNSRTQKTEGGSGMAAAPLQTPTTPRSRQQCGSAYGNGNRLWQKAYA